jgi:non-specific serine/threonine protein kinase
VTSLIGRESEAQAIANVIATTARFLTLTGPGGVGKTRLAIRAAELLGDRFADGIVFVSLADIGEPRLVLPAIARALGLREVANRPPEEAVRSYFSRREALLVLDNLEHLVEAGPALSGLLAHCAYLRILATSRRPIEVYGEQVVRVRPLDTPRQSAPETALRESAAMRLFIERARAVSPDFAPGPASLGAIAEIVLRLDGLPLAIELAAARIADMPPEVLLARLATRLPMLVGRNRDMPSRLRTMRSAISWSHDLLGPDEQGLWRKLAVFNGDFGLRAAQAVAGTAEAGGAEPEQLLQELVDASLLRRAGWLDGEPRYAWLETIREFGLERLEEAGESGETHARHAALYADFTEEARTHLHGPQQRLWLDRLEQEHTEIQAALAWSLEHEPDTALRMGAALWLFWNKRGHQSEGRGWLAQALAQAEDAPAALRAEGLMGFGSTIAMQGELALATTQFNEALAIWRKLGSDAGMARAFTLLGNAASQAGDFAKSASLHHQALLRYPGTGQAPWEGVTTVFLGFAKAMLGDDRGGLELIREGLSLLETIGETWATAVALDLYGDVLAVQGNTIEAARQYVESLARLTAEGEPWTAVWPLVGLASIAQATNQNDVAAGLIGVIDARVEANGGMLEPTAAIRFSETVTQLETTFAADHLRRERAAGAGLAANDVVDQARRFVCTLADGTNDALGTLSRTSQLDDACASLTPREREVLMLVADGLSDKAIADRLFISPRTVANHMNHILGKLDVGSRAAAVAQAIRAKQI